MDYNIYHKFLKSDLNFIENGIRISGFFIPKLLVGVSNKQVMISGHNDFFFIWIREH